MSHRRKCDIVDSGAQRNLLHTRAGPVHQIETISIKFLGMTPNSSWWIGKRILSTFCIEFVQNSLFRRSRRRCFVIRSGQETFGFFSLIIFLKFLFLSLCRFQIPFWSRANIELKSFLPLCHSWLPTRSDWLVRSASDSFRCRQKLIDIFRRRADRFDSGGTSFMKPLSCHLTSRRMFSSSHVNRSRFYKGCVQVQCQIFSVETT